MSPSAGSPAGHDVATPHRGVRGASGVRQIVIVDSSCERYPEFVRAARRGDIGLHFCANGRSAIRFARRFRADAWLVGTQLADMCGFDALEMLADGIRQAAASAACGSLGRGGIFMLADRYCPEEEARALAAGVAGYLVRPVAIDLIGGDRPPLERPLCAVEAV